MFECNMENLEERYDKYLEHIQLFEPEDGIVEKAAKLSEKIKTKRDVQNVIGFLLEEWHEDMFRLSLQQGGLTEGEIRMLREKAAAIKEEKVKQCKRGKRAYKDGVDAKTVYNRWETGETINALAREYSVHRDTIRHRIQEAQKEKSKAERPDKVTGILANFF